MKLTAVALMLSLSFAANAKAGDMSPEVQAVYKEMEQIFGFVPSFVKAFPEEGLPGAWAEMKSLQLNPKTALSGKSKELIGLAVAAQIPCQFCVLFHTEAAKLNGATEREIKEAIAIAAITRHWSTVLNGSQTDPALFKKETQKIVDKVKKDMASGEKMAGAK